MPRAAMFLTACFILGIVIVHSTIEPNIRGIGPFNIGIRAGLQPCPAPAAPVDLPNPLPPSINALFDALETQITKNEARIGAQSMMWQVLYRGKPLWQAGFGTVNDSTTASEKFLH